MASAIRLPISASDEMNGLGESTTMSAATIATTDATTNTTS